MSEINAKDRFVMEILADLRNALDRMTAARNATSEVFKPYEDFLQILIRISSAPPDPTPRTDEEQRAHISKEFASFISSVHDLSGHYHEEYESAQVALENCILHVRRYQRGDGDDDFSSLPTAGHA